MEENNKIYGKLAYKCGICDKEYSSVLERAHCEIECAKRAEEEARKAEEAKRLAEKAMRKEAVDEAFDNLNRLITEYINDYGHYEYDEGGDTTNFYWPTKLWHHFWN